MPQASRRPDYMRDYMRERRRKQSQGAPPAGPEPARDALQEVDLEGIVHYRYRSALRSVCLARPTGALRAPSPSGAPRGRCESCERLMASHATIGARAER